MNLRKEYQKENKVGTVFFTDSYGDTAFTEEYVEWLEEKLKLNTYIVIIVTEGGKDTFLIQAKDLDDARANLKQRGFTYWSSLKLLEFNDDNDVYTIE